MCVFSPLLHLRLFLMSHRLSRRCYRFNVHCTHTVLYAIQVYLYFSVDYFQVKNVEQFNWKPNYSSSKVNEMKEKKNTQKRKNANINI